MTLGSRLVATREGTDCSTAQDPGLRRGAREIAGPIRRRTFTSHMMNITGIPRPGVLEAARTYAARGRSCAESYTRFASIALGAIGLAAGLTGLPRGTWAQWTRSRLSRR